MPSPIEASPWACGSASSTGCAARGPEPAEQRREGCELSEALPRWFVTEISEACVKLRDALDRLAVFEGALPPRCTGMSQPAPPYFEKANVATTILAACRLSDPLGGSPGQHVCSEELSLAPGATTLLRRHPPLRGVAPDAPPADFAEATATRLNAEEFISEVVCCESDAEGPVVALTRRGADGIPAAPADMTKNSTQSTHPSRPSHAERGAPTVQADMPEIIFESEACLREIANWQNKIRRLLVQPSRSNSGLTVPIVQTQAFEAFISLMIAFNAALIGVEVQWKAANPGESAPMLFYVLRQICAAVFIIEFVMRWWAFGFFELFCRHGIGWPHFDAIMVASVIFELIVDVANMLVRASDETTNRSSSFGQMRILRALRVTRLIRTLRFNRIIRFISPLRTLVFSIAATLKSLFWSLVLLVMMMYMVGTMITQSALEYIEMGDDLGMEQELCNYWCSLDTTMMTLFQSIAGGVSWREPLNPLQRMSLVMSWVAVGHISLVYFAVLNVVTAVFCTRAIETTQKNPELVAQAIINNRQDYINNLNSFFEAIDTSNTGSITLDDFRRALADPQRKVPQATNWTFMLLLDTHVARAIS